MIAFQISAPNFSRIVIAESSKSCPVFEQDDITHDKGASYAFDADGELLNIIQGSPYRFPGVKVTRTALPDWAKKKADLVDSEQPVAEPKVSAE